LRPATGIFCGQSVAGDSRACASGSILVYRAPTRSINKNANAPNAPPPN
jgi:hypothetical protein